MSNRRGQPWTKGEEKRLIDGFREGQTIDELVILHERNHGGIRSRLLKLGYDPDALVDRPSDGSSQVTPNELTIEETEVEVALKALDLSVRFHRAISALNVRTLEHLRELTSQDFRSFGRRTQQEWQSVRNNLFPDIVAPVFARPVSPEDKWGELAPYGAILDTAQSAFQAALLALHKPDAQETVSRAAAALIEIIARNPIAQPQGVAAAENIKLQFEDMAMNEPIIEMVAEVIENSRTDERDRVIVRARLGFDNPVALGAATLEEIGDWFDISGKRVWQLEKAAFKKLVFQARQEPWRTRLTLLVGRILSQFPRSSTDSQAKIADWALAALGSGRLPVYVIAFWLTILDRRDSPRALKLAETLLRNARSRAVEVARQERERTRGENELDANIVRWQRALTDIVFPKNRQRFNNIPAEWRSRKREPRGLFGSAIEYDSIKAGRLVLCESEAELRFYQILDNLPQIRAWAEQPLRIPFKQEGCDFGYVPDAVALMESGDLVVIEVKSTLGLATSNAREKARAAVHHLSGLGVSYLLCTADGLSFQKLKQQPTNAELYRLLEEELSQKSDLRWKHVQPLMEKANASGADLANAIIASSWTFSMFPFQLQAQSALIL